MSETRVLAGLDPLRPRSGRPDSRLHVLIGSTLCISVSSHVLRGLLVFPLRSTLTTLFRFNHLFKDFVLEYGHIGGTRS